MVVLNMLQIMRDNKPDLATWSVLVYCYGRNKMLDKVMEVVYDIMLRRMDIRPVQAMLHQLAEEFVTNGWMTSHEKQHLMEGPFDSIRRAVWRMSDQNSDNSLKEKSMTYNQLIYFHLAIVDKKCSRAREWTPSGSSNNKNISSSSSSSSSPSSLFPFIMSKIKLFKKDDSKTRVDFILNKIKRENLILTPHVSKLISNQ